MSNVNAALNTQDEIALDDLFAEIDGLDGLATAPVEPIANELDEIDLLVEAVIEEAPKAEPAVEVEAAPVEPETTALELDDLDGLFDENDLQLDDLNLDAIVEEAPAAEVEAKVEKAPKAEKKEAPKAKAEKKEVSPNTYRTTYYNSSKSKVLLDRLGGDTSDIVLEFSDAELSDEDLAKKQRAFLSLLNNQPTVNSDGQTVQKKVAEKVVILFTMFKLKKSWNEVMYRTFKTLLTDGYIQSGEKGNLHAELLAKPYSLGTARAQAGQMMQMLPLLKITKEDGKGRLIPNDESTILARLKAEYFPDLKAKDAE